MLNDNTMASIICCNNVENELCHVIFHAMEDFSHCSTSGVYLCSLSISLQFFILQIFFFKLHKELVSSCVACVHSELRVCSQASLLLGCIS